MKLNLKEFFSIGNKATVPAVSEDNNTGLTMHVGDDYEQMQDYDGDEEEKEDHGACLQRRMVESRFCMRIASFSRCVRVSSLMSSSASMC